MKRGRDHPWMCFTCGYAMDAYNCTTEPSTAPAEGDISLCLNCGALHTRHGERWQPMTTAEREQLTPEERRNVAMAQLARSRVIDKDMNKVGGHA